MIYNYLFLIKTFATKTSNHSHNSRENNAKNREITIKTIYRWKLTYRSVLIPNFVEQMIFFIENLFSKEIIDIVYPKIEGGECLYWSIMVYTQSIRRQVVLPCCWAVLEPDVVPLQHRYSCSEDWEWWVSILIDNGVYAVNQKTSCLTVLLCNAWARCFTSSSPILFELRSSVVSVYIDR